MKDLKVNLLCLILVCLLVVDATASADLKVVDVTSLLNSSYTLNKKQFENKAKKLGLEHWEIMTGTGTKAFDVNIDFEYSLGEDSVYHATYNSFPDSGNQINMYYNGFEITADIRAYFRKKTGKFLAVNFSTEYFNNHDASANVVDCFWKKTVAAKGYKKVSRKYGKACVIKKDSKNKLVLVKYSQSLSETSSYQHFGYAWMPVKSYKALLANLNNI